MTDKRVNALMKTLQTRQKMQDDDNPAMEEENAAETQQSVRTAIVRQGRERKKKDGAPSLVGKSANPAYTQVSAYVLGQVYDDVRVQLIKEGKRRDFSDLVGELLDQWLRKQKA